MIAANKNPVALAVLQSKTNEFHTKFYGGIKLNFSPNLKQSRKKLSSDKSGVEPFKRNIYESFTCDNIRSQ